MNNDQLQEGRRSVLFTFRNFIILLVGFALGYFIKLQAVQTITMGYDDYKLSQWQINNQDNTEVTKEETKGESQIKENKDMQEAEDNKVKEKTSQESNNK